MPIIDEIRILERPSERLGVLWRSEGQAFLDEQAAELQDDVERLRTAYLANAGGAPAWSPTVREQLRQRVPKVIDLREHEPVVAEVVTDRVCTTEGHGDIAATTRCTRCHGVFCSRCVVKLRATHDQPLCKECALITAGVHHKRSRQPSPSGRPKALRSSGR